MRAQHQDPEVRNSQRERALPLFESALLGTGESTETKDSSPQPRESAKPKARILPRQSPGEQTHARHSDPINSHKAAASVVNLGRTRDAILALLANHSKGLTDQQIWEEYWRQGGPNLARTSPSGLRSRRRVTMRKHRASKSLK